MISPQEIYQQINNHLQNSMTVDLSTLSSLNEKEDLESQVRHLLNAKYGDSPKVFRDRVLNEFLNCGPLEGALQDNEITEMLINSESDIWVEKNGKLQPLQDKFFSHLSYQNFLQRMTAESKLQINLERPYVDGYWRQYRVHLIIPPIAKPGPLLSLRRHPENSWTFARFAEIEWAPADALELIKNLVVQNQSFLIVGSTGSGKTSVLSACLNEIDKNERVVAIEDTPELHLPNKQSAKLLTRHDAQGLLKNIDQGELLRQALRMRPDRIVMGEVRGQEAKDLLMALSTGHRGGMATLHAESAKQALYRLEMLIQMGAPQWSLQAIRNLIFFGLQAVICVEKHNGVRKLNSIYKITSLEEHGFCLECLWAKSLRAA